MPAWHEDTFFSWFRGMQWIYTRIHKLNAKKQDSFTFKSEAQLPKEHKISFFTNAHLLYVKSQLSRHCFSSRQNVFASESSDTCQCSPLNLKRLIHWPPSISGWNHSEVYVSSPAPVSVTGIIWVNWYVEECENSFPHATTTQRC